MNTQWRLCGLCEREARAKIFTSPYTCRTGRQSRPAHQGDGYSSSLNVMFRVMSVGVRSIMQRTSSVEHWRRTSQMDCFWTVTSTLPAWVTSTQGRGSRLIRLRALAGVTSSMIRRGGIPLSTLRMEDQPTGRDTAPLWWPSLPKRNRRFASPLLSGGWISTPARRVEHAPGGPAGAVYGGEAQQSRCLAQRGHATPQYYRAPLTRHNQATAPLQQRVRVHRRTVHRLPLPCL